MHLNKGLCNIKHNNFVDFVFFQEGRRIASAIQARDIQIISTHYENAFFREIHSIVNII